MKKRAQILGWSIRENVDGTFTAYRRSDGRTISRFIGKDRSKARRVLAAENQKLGIPLPEQKTIERGEQSMNLRDILKREAPPQEEAPAPPSERPSLIDQALQCARSGLLIGPIHALKNGLCTCGKEGCPGNHPAAPNRSDIVGTFKGAFYGTTDTTAIKHHLFRNSSVNLAAELGQRSKLVALVVSGPDGEEALIDLQAQHGPLPDTLQFTSGPDQRILLFTTPSKFFQIFSKKHPGEGLVLLLNSGEYQKTRWALIPPSEIESGEKFQWIIGAGPGEVTLAEIPLWLLNVSSV